MEFLRARWQDLLLVTYAVPDDWLRPYLPAGLALDRWEGSACVSLVAFDFRDTRVLRVAWPGCVSFPEVNLRFAVTVYGYVRLPGGARPQTPTGTAAGATSGR